MRYSIVCNFRPGAAALARQKRLEHYEFLRREREGIVEGGPLLGTDGLPEAMLIVVERESIEAAAQFIAQEPYTASGFFEAPVIREWRLVLPEPEPGFVENEYQKELLSRMQTR
jgi:uncharacterized protein YciI